MKKVVHDKVVLINATNLFVRTTKLKSKLYIEIHRFIMKKVAPLRGTNKCVNLSVQAKHKLQVDDNRQ